MKSLLKRKKTWLLLALLLLTTSCTLTTCKLAVVNGKIVVVYYYYTYDFFGRTDVFPSWFYDAENSSTGALSQIMAPSWMATDFSFLPGTPAQGITGYSSTANPGAWGIYVRTAKTISWLNGTNGSLLGSLSVTTPLRDFQIAPDGNSALGSDGVSGNIYDFGLNPMKLNYTYNVGSAATLNRIAWSPDSSKAIITDFKIGAYYEFNPTTRTSRAMTVPSSNLGGAAFSPDGWSYGITVGGSNPGVVFYDTPTNTMITTVPGMPNPTDLTFNQTGTKAYVLSSPATGMGSVFRIDMGNFNLGSSVTVGNEPTGFAWSLGYRTLVTANYGSGTLSAIDTTNWSNSGVTSIQVGTNPTGVAWAPFNIANYF